MISDLINIFNDYYHGQTDADGNMTFRDGWTQIWNAENRLVEMYNATTKLTFSYDYMGRRIEKNVFQQAGGIWAPLKSLQFVYDGYKLVEEIDILPDDKPVIRRYTWQPESQGADLPIMLTDVASNQNYFYTADGNKNISELVDGTGAVVAHYEYDPFGKINSQTGPYALNNPFRFSSEYHDDETGLVYYNYRYYSPTIGRWINRDPIGEFGGVNLYAMVGNRVSNYWDKLGLKFNPNDECTITIAIGHSDVITDIYSKNNAQNFPNNNSCVIGFGCTTNDYRDINEFLQKNGYMTKVMYDLFSRLPAAVSRLDIPKGAGVIMEKLDEKLTEYQGQMNGEYGGYGKPPKYSDKQWNKLSMQQKYRAALRSIINAAYKGARDLLKRDCCDSVTIRVILLSGSAGGFNNVTEFLNDAGIPYGPKISLGFEVKNATNATMVMKK